jgi:uncharacterized membrane protein YebE (DUF533 family)
MAIIPHSPAALSRGTCWIMSLYEALALAALVAVGGFAYYLYRSDIRPKSPGEQRAELPESQPMFARPRQETGADKPPKS